MTIVLQKAVTPAQVTAYLTEGYDRISGYVVRAAEVSDVADVPALRRLHLLDAIDSRHPADGPVHILHIDRSPSWQLTPATAMAERPALPTSGTVEVAERLVELFYLDHSRLTSGARLWRFEEGADPLLVATYAGPAVGWVDHTNDEATKVAVPVPSTGSVVVLDDKAFVADVTSGDDGVPTAITAVAPSRPPEELGFAEAPSGFWTKDVAHADVRALFELRVTATWNGVPVQVAQNFKLPDDRLVTRVVSLAHDWQRASDARLTEMELGVWEATVPTEEVTGIAPQEVAAQPWMTPWQRERLAKAQQASQNNVVAAPGGNVQAHGFAPDAPDAPRLTTSEQPAAQPGLNDAAHMQLYQRIAQGTLPHIPKGAAKVAISCQSIGNLMDLAAQSLDDDGAPTPLPTLSQDVARAFGELRTLGARTGEGPWFVAIATLTPGGSFTIRFRTNDQPLLRNGITAEALRVERERFPRTSYPDWFTALEEAGGAAPWGGPAGGSGDAAGDGPGAAPGGAGSDPTGL